MESFGTAPLDTEDNREFFEEQLHLLLKCFKEDAFYHKGKYYQCPPSVPYRDYQLEEITVVPRPKHLRVEIWMPIASGRTIIMMAKYGLKAMVTLSGEKSLRTWSAPFTRPTSGMAALHSFMIHCAEGLPPAEFKEQLRWFAKDVMPAFNRA